MAKDVISLKYKLISLLIIFIVCITIVSPNIVDASTKVMWGKTELKIGQIGKLTIQSDTDLIKIESNGSMTVIRPLKKGEEYRVYSFRSSMGGLYGVGGGSYVQNNAKVKYETPSKSKLALLHQLPTNQSTFNKEGFVNVSILNMRSGPSTNNTIIKKLSKGQKVSMGNTVDEWVYISVDGITGYVNSSYLNFQGEVSSTPTPTNPLSSQTIVIDAGHGYTDPGASGFGILEKDVTLDTSLRLAAYVEMSPFNVVLTRDRDTKVELNDRVKIANNAGGDLFVSIHANSANGKGHGTETYFTTTKNPNTVQSKAEATYIQNRLLASWELSNRGVKDGNFHVIRENSMPAVLVELGFIDNKEDNDKLRSPQMREEAAKAIYLGILDYYYHYEKLDVVALYNAIGENPSKKLH